MRYVRTPLVIYTLRRSHLLSVSTAFVILRHVSTPLVIIRDVSTIVRYVSTALVTMRYVSTNFAKSVPRFRQHAPSVPGWP
eukprot:3624631-Rhodomonas_salina.2